MIALAWAVEPAASRVPLAQVTPDAPELVLLLGVALVPELLPHAAAEERSIYPAGDRGLTAMLVQAMLTEHKNLIAHVAGLRDSAEAIEAVGSASAIQALFESHLSKENDLLLPALIADPSVSLGALLGGMHEILG